MGACQAQQLGNNQLQLLNQNGDKQEQQMTKKERKQHKIDQLAYLEERYQKLKQNQYDYQNLLTNIRSNIMFDDLEFPPNSISIGDIQKQDDIQWMRIRQLLDHDKSIEQKFDSLSLIRGTLEENDMAKIFFQQMLTYMASYEGIIEQFLIIEKDDQILQLDQSQDFQQPHSPQLGNRKQNYSHVISSGKKKLDSQDFPKETNNSFNLRKNGMYGVYLFKNKIRQQIIVDDYIPCNNQGTLFLQTQNNQFWPLIIEKAAAKIAQSYTNFYNISILKMVSMFFNSRVMGVNVQKETTLISYLENQIGVILKNANSFIFIYGPRNTGDKFYFEYESENYFQFNSYGQDIPKQKELNQSKDEKFKALIEDKKIQKDSVFMSFKEMKDRFKIIFLLNMRIMYPVIIEKSHQFKNDIQIEMCNFNIKEKTIIQFKYKLTNNISCINLTLLECKNGEDSIDSDIVIRESLDEVKPTKTNVLIFPEPGKKCLLIQTIMKNQNDMPDYILKIKMSEKNQQMQSQIYQEKLLYEFQKKLSNNYKEFKLGDKMVMLSISYIGLMAQLNFTFEQFGQIEGILEFQFDLIGWELDKENNNQIFYFQEQVHILKAIRTSKEIDINARMRLIYDIDCQARKEYNEYSHIFSVWEISKNFVYKDRELFLNLKQITKNDQWFFYIILETRQLINHKLKFEEIEISIPNQPNISVKQDGEIMINIKQSHLIKYQITEKIEQSDLEKSKITFLKSSFLPIQ